jgi:chorismate-pyruvate lyase
MRNDLQKSLNRHHIEPSSLSIFQRILLTTDGTVTDILESYLSEPIQLVKLSEALITLEQDIPAMQLKTGAEVIKRKILLRGRISRKTFIFADSIIVLDRLDEDFRNELLKTKTPIGKLWLEHRIESFKEIVDSGKEAPTEELSHYFQLQPNINLFFRTYCVFSNSQAIMMITEKFPENYFINAFDTGKP